MGAVAISGIALGLMAAGASSVWGASWRPPDNLLYAVHFVESSHGLFIVGDHGQSLGEYQLSEAAWLDVSWWRKARGLPTYSYERHVWDRQVSRDYAANYMSILYGVLKKRLKRPPTAAEVYAAYNMGLGSFAQCRYRLAHVNPTTARKCEQIKTIMRSQ
jgi:hypothetical protein